MSFADYEPARLEELFDRAADLDGPGRQGVLADVRSRQPALARELESLLAYHDGDSSRPDFLRTPASLELLDDPGAGEPELDPGPFQPEALIGFECGGFRIAGLLGAGGMGQVYEAVQERPRRRVALKVVAEARTPPDVRARFAHEAETLARLDHPHVARIFGAGTAVGPQGPFSWIAVEHIPEPLSLTEYAGREGLGREARLRLFLPVCEAVHHAHRKGVLHRDLKPANLLVAGSGEGGARVIDFGLARLLEPLGPEEQLRTRSGELLGTLRYMSPEQCAGDPGQLDVRTDVYSLGVVLYELLTGGWPHDLRGSSLLTILETIRTAEPRDPRPRLGDDLGTVLLKALAVEPDDRYDSAGALADDLRRWLAREPVQARPASRLHRLALFARRRTPLFSGLVLGAAAALLALATILHLFFENRAALQQARDAQQATAEQRRMVEDARSELGELQGRLDALLGSGQGAGDADLAAALVQTATAARESAASPEERREAVARAVAQLRALAGVLESDPRSAASLAAAFVKVGDLHGSEWNASAADAENSLQAYFEGARLWRRVLAGRPEDGAAQAALVAALVQLAHAYRKVDRQAEGLSYAEEAVVLARRRVPPAGIGPSGAFESEAVELLIEALWARGDLHIQLEPFERGLEDSRAALDWVERTLEFHRGDPGVHLTAAWTLLRVGIWVGRLEGDREGALAHHARAVDLLLEALDAPDGGAGDEPRRADLIYNLFLWNEMWLLFDLRTEDELRARLRHLVDAAAGLRETESVVRVLSMVSWLTARLLDLCEDPTERAALRAWLGAMYVALPPGDVERVLAEVRERRGELILGGPRGVELMDSLVAGELPR